MLAALAQRHDFLEGTVGPAALGPLADALAHIGDAHAAPLLAAHLLDPATPIGDVERCAAALAVLARPEQMNALRLEDEFQRLNTRAGQVVERFGVVDAAVGEAKSATDIQEVDWHHHHVVWPRSWKS